MEMVVKNRELNHFHSYIDGVATLYKELKHKRTGIGD